MGSICKPELDQSIMRVPIDLKGALIAGEMHTYDAMQTMANTINATAEEVNRATDWVNEAGETLAENENERIENEQKRKEEFDIMKRTSTGARAFTYRDNLSELPLTPNKDEQMLAYVIDGTVYMYVGFNGDVLDGKYKNVGKFQGEKGEKGEAFKYSDFTPEQLAALKGAKGDQGDRGEVGPAGHAGPIGDKGDKGDKGEDGDTSACEAIVSEIRDEIQQMQELETTDPALIAKVAKNTADLSQLAQEIDCINDAGKHYALIEGYLNAYGTLSPGNGLCTDYIAVSEGESVRHYGKYGTALKAVWGYSDKFGNNPVAVADFGDNNVVDFSIPSGVKYIRGWGIPSSSPRVIVGKNAIDFLDLESKSANNSNKIASNEKITEALSRGVVIGDIEHYQHSLAFEYIDVYADIKTYNQLRIAVLVINDDGDKKNVQMQLFNDAEQVFAYSKSVELSSNNKIVFDATNNNIVVSCVINYNIYTRFSNPKEGLFVKTKDIETYKNIKSAEDTKNALVKSISKDRVILSESGLMGKNGSVGDTAFVHSTPISVIGASKLVVTTNMAVVSPNYCAIVLFKNGVAIDGISPKTGGTETTTITDFNGADSVILNCHNQEAKLNVFLLSVEYNSLSEIDSRLSLIETKIDSKGGKTMKINPASGDLRSILESIKDASADVPYTVYLEEGTYDLSNSFTEDEINNSKFYGVFVPNFVTLEGVDKRKTIITCTLPTKNEHISTLNLMRTAAVKNMTIIGTRTRYAVHDDFATLGDTTEKHYYREYDNCVFKAVENYYSLGLACATRSGAIVNIKNCEIIGSGSNAFAWHDNIGFEVSCDITIINTTFTSATDRCFVLRCFGGSKTNRFHLYGCKTRGYQFREEVEGSGTGLSIEVDGYGNNYDAKIEVTTANPDFVDFKPSFVDAPSNVLQNGYFVGARKFDSSNKTWKTWNGTAWG